MRFLDHPLCLISLRPGCAMEGVSMDTAQGVGAQRTEEPVSGFRRSPRISYGYRTRRTAREVTPTCDE